MLYNPGRMRRSAAPFLVALSVFGCQRKPEPVPYAQISTESEQTATLSGPNAFDRYASLADEAAKGSTVPLDARDTPGTRKKVLEQLGGCLDRLAGATKLPCAFKFSTVGPFEARPHQEGWLQLGRAMVWKIEKCADDGDWLAASRWTAAALAFGFDLGGGSMSDSSLGYGIADGARAAIAPFLSTMPQDALAELNDGAAVALSRCPDASVTIENEGRLMLAAVQALQDAHKEGKITEFAARLYGPSRTSVLELQKLDDEDRGAFFRSLLDEEARTVEQLEQRSQTPGAKRGSISASLSGDARKIADQFFSAGEPWLRLRDRAVARTRLLYVTTSLCRYRSEHGALPKDLTLVSEEGRTDPYTGLPFGYLALGQEFVVYSCGIDGKDDRGDTDAARTEPDLLLEDSGR